jgi:hypothetical protein
MPHCSAVGGEPQNYLSPSARSYPFSLMAVWPCLGREFSTCRQPSQETTRFRAGTCAIPTAWCCNDNQYSASLSSCVGDEIEKKGQNMWPDKETRVMPRLYQQYCTVRSDRCCECSPMSAKSLQCFDMIGLPPIQIDDMKRSS